MYYSNRRHYVDNALEQRGRDLQGPSRRMCHKVETVEVANTVPRAVRNETAGGRGTTTGSAKREITWIE
jgi:hypothetical protein